MLLYELPSLLPSIFVGPPKLTFGTDAIFFGCYEGTIRPCSLYGHVHCFEGGDDRPGPSVFERFAVRAAVQDVPARFLSGQRQREVIVTVPSAAAIGKREGGMDGAVSIDG